MSRGDLGFAAHGAVGVLCVTNYSPVGTNDHGRGAAVRIPALHHSIRVLWSLRRLILAVGWWRRPRNTHPLQSSSGLLRLFLCMPCSFGFAHSVFDLSFSLRIKFRGDWGS